MNDHQAWQMLFPAVSPESRQIFLNNRHGTQIPESIIQSITSTLNAGISCNTENEGAELRQRLATFLHVERPDTFFFSEGEAGILSWFAYVWGWEKLQDGDEVILSSQDAPMIMRIFAHLRRQMADPGRSLVLKEFDYKENGEFDRKGILSFLSKKTRLIFVPHIHAVFGTKNEDDIAFLKQQVGDQALVVVDLSQSVGRIPVYLERLNCDVAFFSGRNLFSPFHSAIGYIRPGLYTDTETFLQRQPVNPVAAQTLVQAIEMLERIGMKQIALHVQALSQALLTGLQQMAVLEFLPGMGRCEQWCSPGYGILSFQLPGISAEECRMLLADHGLLVDLADLPRYPDALTVSLHFYNTFQHIHALIECLQHLCI